MGVERHINLQVKIYQQKYRESERGKELVEKDDSFSERMKLGYSYFIFVVYNENLNHAILNRRQELGLRYK